MGGDHGDEEGAPGGARLKRVLRSVLVVGKLMRPST